VRELLRKITVPQGRAVVVVETTKDNVVEIPFTWFTTSTCAPNFDDAEIVDDGQTIRLGRYEADGEFALEEHKGR
jgi:hypothetical protein